MILPDWLLILMAGLYLINLLGFSFWLGKLSNRVTALENRECRIEEMSHKLDIIAVDVAVIKTQIEYLKGLS